MPSSHGPKVEKFYHSAQWYSARDFVLARDKYRCVVCGRVGNTVHHIISLTEENYTDPKISLDPKNLQTVCYRCHEQIHGDIKTGFAKKPTITIFDRNGNVVVEDKKQEGEIGNERRKR